MKSFLHIIQWNQWFLQALVKSMELKSFNRELDDGRDKNGPTNTFLSIFLFFLLTCRKSLNKKTKTNTSKFIFLHRSIYCNWAGTVLQSLKINNAFKHIYYDMCFIYWETVPVIISKTRFIFLNVHFLSVGQRSYGRMFGFDTKHAMSCLKNSKTCFKNVHLER